MYKCSCRNTCTYISVQNNTCASPPHCTAKLRVCVLLIPPPVPVTVRIDVPTLAVGAAFSVSLLLPLLAMLAGAKLAVTPFGNPLTDSVIAEVNPLTATVVTVIGIDPPRATITFVPPSVRLKLGTMTVRLSACVFVTPPPEPVTFSE